MDLMVAVQVSEFRLAVEEHVQEGALPGTNFTSVDSGLQCPQVSAWVKDRTSLYLSQ